MRIAHVSDIHIKNTKEHEAYKKVFDELYASIKSNNIDLIVVTGDIAHSKTQISPEYVSIASAFISELGKLAKTIIIPGNHDGNLKNLDRQDAIEPLMWAQDSARVEYNRKSCTYDLGKFQFHHLSIFDRINWPTEIDAKKINIALYHGCIAGAKTDLGFSLEGENDVSIFKMYDFGLLGDIHKANQSMDKAGTVRYAGSLIQQNFGEEEGKGYLIWDISTKKKFNVEFVPLKNEHSYVSIPVSDIGKKRELFETSNVRIVADKFYNHEQVKKKVDEFKAKTKVQNVYFLNAQKSNTTDLLVSKSIANIKDSQDEILAEYLILNNVSDDMIKKVLELNRSVVGSARKTEFDRWTIKDLKFDNTFNYGLGNSIDLMGTSGIVGIFGKSFSGKSSIIDSLMLSIFGKTSKDINKNSHIINVNRDYASTEVTLSAGGDEYFIERFSQRNKDSTKNSLDFYKVSNGERLSLNGDTLNDTEKNIQELFGDDSDFMLTSLASQHGSLKFITEKSTDRKRILSKFLDIDFLESKYKEANKSFADVKGALGYLNSKAIEVSKEERQELALDRVSLTLSQDCLEGYKEYKSEIEKKIKECQTNPVLYQETMSDAALELARLDAKIKEASLSLNSKKASLLAIINKVKGAEEALSRASKIDLDSLIKKHAMVTELKRGLEEEKGASVEMYERYKESKKNISSSPCSSDYSHCKMSKEAHSFISSFDQKKFISEINTLSEKIVNVSAEIEEIGDIEEIRGKKAAKESLTGMLNVLKTSMKTEEESVLYLETQFESMREGYETLTKKAKGLSDGGAKEEVQQELEKLETLLLTNGFSIKIKEEEITTLKIKISQVEDNIKKEEETKKEIEEQREKYDLYQVYKDAMHPNGLQSYVIKQKIPEINNQIASILSNIVDFNVIVEYNDPKLDVMIRHPGEEARVIETASGAEKSLASFAIRFALINITNLPKSDLLIMDEPASEFDEDIKASFEGMLGTIRQWFKTIMIISHIDSIKDIVDQEIVIENKNGFAFVDV